MTSHQSEWPSECLQIKNAREGMEKREPSYTIGGNVSSWKIVWRCLKKLKIKLPYDPAVPLLGMFTDKTMIWKGTHTSMFRAALLTIAKTRKATYICTDRGMHTENIMHTQWKYCSAMKKNEITLPAATRMELEIIKLREVRKKKTNAVWYTWNPKYGTNELIYKTEIDSWTQRTDL